MTPTELLSIIVPVYNEAGTVASVIRRLLSIDLPLDREVIVVNDGSSDGTREVLDALAGTSDRLTVIHAPKNQGKGAAIRLGLARTTGSIVSIQDADLELDPAQLATLVGPILKGDTRVVYGSRFLGARPKMPSMSYYGNRFLTTVTNVMYGSRLTDMETCYKVMRGDIARGLALESNRFDIEVEVTAKLLRGGNSIVELPVAFTSRGTAEGKKMRWRDGIGAVRALVRYRFSTRAR